MDDFVPVTRVQQVWIGCASVFCVLGAVAIILLAGYALSAK